MTDRGMAAAVSMRKKPGITVAEWTPAEALSFWKACYAHNLEPSRLPARSAHLIAALLAKRFALSSRVLLIGERDPSLIEALLTAGFPVARADVGPWLRQPSIAIEGHARWLGSLPRLDDASFDVVLSVGLLECLGDGEVAPFLTALRYALRHGGQVVIAVPNREQLEQQLALCPKTGTMFHREQRVRAFDRLTLPTMLAHGGLQTVSQLEIALDDHVLVEHAARVFALSPKTFVATGAVLIAFAQSAGPPDRPVPMADAEGANAWLSGRRRLAASVTIPDPQKWIWTGPAVDEFWSSIAGTPLDDLSFGKVLGQILLRGVEPWLVPGGRHLDVGAGEGHMAEVMAAAGYPVAALEPSLRRAETIDARLASRRNFLGRLTRIQAAQKGSFDIVLACEVIEHVLEGDLGDFFALMKCALKPEGRIILSTPNEEDLRRAEVYSPFGNVLFHRWQHVRSLNKAKLENLLRRYGFEPDVVHEVDLAAALDQSAPTLEHNLGSAMSHRCGKAANLIVIAYRRGESPRPARRLADAERRIERPVGTQGVIAREKRLMPGRGLAAIELAVDRAERAEGACYTLPLPSRVVAADGEGTPRRSTLRLFEDGKELGPAHAVHASIAALGGGQFSHWDKALLFSSSDGTDPTRNGRHYTALAEVAPASLRHILNAGRHRMQVWKVPASRITAGEGRLCEVRLPRLFAKGDDLRNPTRSGLQLFEDALLLGPAHAPRDAIRTDGKGRYAHCQGTLAFSSSDGTDPCHNGRRYVVVAPRKRSRLRRAIATAARATVKAMLPTARAVLPASVRAGVARYYDVALSRVSRADFLERAVPLAAFEPAMTRNRFSSGPVVLCNNALAWGGAERQVVNTLKGLARRLHRPPHLLCLRLGCSADHDFYRCALADFPGEVRNVIDVDAARRVLASIDAGLEQRIARAAAWLPADVQLEILRFAGDFADLKPSLVHVWQDALSISAGYAAHMIGVPKVLVSSRNMAASRFAYHRPYMADAYREVASCSDILMLNNSAAGARDYAQWLGLPVERFRILRNGIDAAEMKPPAYAQAQALRVRLALPPEAPVIGSIFRFYAEKRPKLWIEAAARIAAARSDCHFVVFGSGPLTGEVLAIARSHRFADRLHLPGTIEKAALGLAIMDLFLLTSELEGTPNVVLEASLMGVPVVATDAGGSRETIEEGVTGFIVAPSEPERLARRALAVLGDEAWRREVRKAGPRFVQSRFGLDRMIDETLVAYGLKER
jgi:glycosyltransferase involved in cell wall biosynthesis/2-polyprenyl-3-methyl-5-hydroxy-6-metoxy-1,4-benzoquinol methylase